MPFRERYTFRGYRYQVWEPDEMPRLPEANIKACFFLYPTDGDANSSAPFGGTGFFVGVRTHIPSALRHVYAVTNRHNVFGCYDIEKCIQPTIRVNTKDGKFDLITPDPSEWRVPSSGDDFAVCRVSLNKDVHDTSNESLEMFLDQDMIKRYEIGIGDDVFSYGRFLQEEIEKGRNNPVCRFGNVSLMPEIAIEILERGVPRRFQDSYLVEMRSRTGFSGSPVYVYIDHLSDFTDRLRRGVQRRGPWVLGLYWGQLGARGPETNVPSPRESLATAITGVVPAYRIKNFLLTDPVLRAERDEIEAIELADVDPLATRVEQFDAQRFLNDAATEMDA